MVAILAAVLTYSKMAAADESVTLEDIQAIATRWRASFVNLRVVYETRGLPPRRESLIEWSAPEDFTAAPLVRSVEWIWADHGLDLFDGRSFYWSPGKTGIRSIDGFNGPKNLSFRALYRRPPGEAETLVEVGMQRVGGKSTSWLNRAPMRGLYWANTAEWLPEVLAGREWVLEGVEPVLGIPCAKLSTRYVRGKDTHVDLLWLDLAHDGLPRRYQRLANSERTAGSDFIVDEVQQLPEGIWFPKQARLQLQSDPVQNQLIVITEAAINIELDLSRFDPPAPVQGTLIADGRIGRAYRFGVDPAPTEPALPNPPEDTSHSALIAKPDFWLNVSFALLCLAVFVSVLSLIVGIWLRVRAFRT